MSTYYQIQSDEMETFMLARGFCRFSVEGTYEELYAKDVVDKPGLEIRVFTSIGTRDGDARTVGTDAIRVVIFSTVHNRGVGSEARVYRTTGWAKNLASRIDDTIRQASTGLVQCPDCKAWMVEREGKYGKFFGCIRYPACRGIRRIQELRKCG